MSSDDAKGPTYQSPTNERNLKMTIYNVHIYREMRLTFENVEADTPEAAAAIARDKMTSDADEIDDCEGESFSALVDVKGDDEYGHSRVIDFEAERQRNTARHLLEALSDLVEQADEDCPAVYRSRHFIDALENARNVIDKTDANVLATSEERSQI